MIHTIANTLQSGKQKKWNQVTGSSTDRRVNHHIHSGTFTSSITNLELDSTIESYVRQVQIAWEAEQQNASIAYTKIVLRTLQTLPRTPTYYDNLPFDHSQFRRLT